MSKFLLSGKELAICVLIGIVGGIGSGVVTILTGFSVGMTELGTLTGVVCGTTIVMRRKKTAN